MNAATTVIYRFHFSSGRSEEVRLDFLPEMIVRRRSEEPAWTRLENHRCGHCPLEEHGTCPFASAVAPFAAQFEDFYSYEPVRVEVVTPHRTITAERDLQHALASLLGLVGATSGCPHLAFFRPMARFHLPFSSEEETLYRAFSAHLLGRYFAGGGDGHVQADFDLLRAEYEAAAKVNRGMADRMRTAFTRDAVVNALVVLDTFAQAAPMVIEDRLEELAYIFEEELTRPPPPGAPAP